MISFQRKTSSIAWPKVLLILGLASGMIMLTMPASAQEFPIEPVPGNSEIRTQDGGLRDVATNADAGAGEIGQRQTGRNYSNGAWPFNRLQTRIENRIQNRLSSRVDRNYDADTGVTASIRRAEGRLRRSTSARPR